MKQDFSFSLIIPVFNEEERFLLPFTKAYRFVREAFSESEFIFVDDGSTDSTRDRLLDLQQEYPGVRMIPLESNCGKGCAIRRGFQEARGDYILFSDADFSTPIEEVEKLFKALDRGYDIAIASRGLPASNIEVHQIWWREAIGKAGNFFIQTMLPLPYHDTQCGFKLFNRKAVSVIFPQMTIAGFAFDVEILAIAMINGLKVQEVPVTWRNDQDTKVRAIHSIQVLRDLFRIRFAVAMGEYA